MPMVVAAHLQMLSGDVVQYDVTSKDNRSESRVRDQRRGLSRALVNSGDASEG